MWNVCLRAETTNDGKTLELDIFDVIGEDFWGNGVSAKDVRAHLRSAGDVGTILLRINSVGGSVSDGFSIYKQIAEHPAYVIADIDNAASMATLIAMAADEVKMAANGEFMIHDPWAIARGKAADLRRAADRLDAVTENAIATYAEKTGLSNDEIRSLMGDETYFSADRAKELGFIDEVVPRKAHPTASTNLLQRMRAGDGIDLLGMQKEVFAMAAKERGDEKPYPAVNPESIRVTFENASDVVLSVKPPTPQPPPAKSGETINKEPSPMSDKLIKALGAKDEDEALKIVETATNEVADAQAAVKFSAAISDATGKSGDEALAIVGQWKADAAFATSVRELTGAEGDKSRAVLDSWKASHERLPEVEKERDEAVNEVAARDAKASESHKAELMQKICDAGKCNEATRDQLATNSVEYLEQWLASAPVVVPGAGAKPVTEPESDKAVALDDEDRRVADALGIPHKDFARAKAERHNLKFDEIDEDEAPVADTNTEEAE